VRVVEEGCGQCSVMYSLASEHRPPGRFAMALLLSVIGLSSVKVVNMVWSGDVVGIFFRRVAGVGERRFVLCSAEQ